MSQYAIPAFLGFAIWWASTCLIMFLDGLPRRTFTRSMAMATMVLAVALVLLRGSAGEASAHGAYVGFTSGVLIWGWLEMSFYMGYVTGPRTHRCDHGCRGVSHFLHAIQACLYHEIAVLLAGAVVIGLTWREPNQFGTWTFIVLWWMHQSARVNVFLGVRNLNAEFLPDHLDHMRGFLTHAPMNLLFPFSITASLLCAVLMTSRALADPADGFNTAGYTLLTTMMALAILEHVFLMMPAPALHVWNRLWRWSLSSRQIRAETTRPRPVSVPAQATPGGHP
jgi:putative photosynthetic complex assembly protein 2